MPRIESCFEALKENGRKALIPFVTAGDPVSDITVPLMHAMADAGADLIELGIPFSDPMADGPVIQKANQRALAHDTSLRDVLDMVKQFRLMDETTPVIFMGYLNPVEAMGYEKFADAAKLSGVDGLLLVDLPPEEACEFNELLYQRDIAPVYLLAPTSTPQRMEIVALEARGFVYYVSIRGVTGSAALDYNEIKTSISEIRQHTNLPVGVGFGINSSERAVKIGEFADAIIIGSAIVRMMEDFDGDKQSVINAVSGFLRGVRDALDADTQ
ncbi:MAG TPA: tryptophan synthase subunit alpha [Gammaproteobacteria bacterium]|nr:tryptophan synthase subunit alpha [Gammaproteobacteria bacterium]